MKRVIGNIGGNVATSDGLFQVGDWQARESKYSLLTQTIENGASLLSRTFDVTTTAYHIGLTVPAGREFIIFARALTLGPGEYDIETITASGGYTGGTASYKTTLKAGGSGSVTSTLHLGVTPVGDITIRDQEHTDTGDAIGAGQAMAAASVEGVLRIFGAGNTGILRITRGQAENYTGNIRVFCWETAV